MIDAGPTAHVVTHPRCSATVLDQGALVLQWTPTGSDPVVFAAPGLRVPPGAAPHAGIPVCWPWFGPGRSGDLSPQHGIVRGARWELVDRDDTDDGVTLHHRITSDDVSSRHFPHRFVLDLRTRLGSTLELELTTTNTDGGPFDLEEALHAYLAVGDVRQVRLDGLDGAEYHDKTTGRDERQEGLLEPAGHIDRVYRSDGPVTVVDPVLGRRLRVTTDGAANRVVWNTWAETAHELDDVGDAWPSFVCVEGANALQDAVTVGVGESRTLRYRVEVLDL
jgi:D-hexose-6-phosphate mutarotase